MFTGIVEEIGKIHSVEKGLNSGKITIAAKKVLEGTNIGDSIAVNGLCLTVTAMGAGYFTADIMPESMRRSNLGGLNRGDEVNLERAMAAEGRFGGHIVSGHIDCTGTISKVEREENAVWVYIDIPEEYLKFVIEKGSAAIDGISLTVAKVTKSGFAVSVIPHTGEETTLLKKKVGNIVNIETDIVGKYIYNFIRPKKEEKKTTLTADFLAENGFL
ncbi:MAG: riboflavin synthase [Firmicutes bacterium]|nr:riboflavin synthase [Bacillota bacterium]